MVKKYIFTLLIGVLVISLIGCGKNTKKDASTNEIQQIVVDNNAVNATVVNGRFCPQSVRSFCPIVAGFNAGTYKVPACVL